MNACIDCRHYVVGMQLCRRFPKAEYKAPDDLCGEYAMPKKIMAQCKRMKANGQPCTAPAVPGKDFCLGHSKKR